MTSEMGHTLPRLGFKNANPYGDRMSVISLDFEDNYGKPRGLKWPHFRHPIVDKDCSNLRGIEISRRDCR